MRIDIHHYFHVLPTGRELANIDAKLARILVHQLRGERIMSEQFDNLSTKVEGLETVGDSLVALLAGMAEEIRKLKDAPTPEAIDALAADVEAKAAEWGAAVVANTPSAPEPPAESESDGA